MLTLKQTKDIANSFKNDACFFMDINPGDICIKTIASLLIWIPQN